MRTVIGIDNGPSGSIGIITDRDSFYLPMPVKKEQSYTKAKHIITRIETRDLVNILWQYPLAQVVIERPMISPARFAATVSAARALEAVLIAVESSKLPYEYLDSRAWQKEMLPEGLKGPELKTASRDVGIRLFPHLAEAIRKQKDADGLLMAEYIRRHR